MKKDITILHRRQFEQKREIAPINLAMLEAVTIFQHLNLSN